MRDCSVKALLLQAYNQLVYGDVSEPAIGPDDVLIQVKACGICGSDVHGLDGSTGRRIPPIVMGHEASGVIAEVGSAVDDWQKGDRVTFDSTIYCGHCHFCRRGQINLCDSRRVLGVSCDEYRQHGAYAEYVAVPQHILYRLPDGLSFEHAGEPLAIACHAVNRAPISLNDAAVVVGCGTIGLMVVQLLRASGCGPLVAVDVDPAKLALARQFGADVAIRSDETDASAEVLKRTDGSGADLSFEVVGIDATQKLAVQSVRKGGASVLIGLGDPTVELAFQAVVTRELTLYGSCACAGEYPICLDMMSKGTVDLDPLMSAVAPLAQGVEWFDRLYRGEESFLKVVLTMG